MSWSDSAFQAGFSLVTPRASTGDGAEPGVIRPLRFNTAGAVGKEPDGPPSEHPFGPSFGQTFGQAAEESEIPADKIRPMVFLQFGASTQEETVEGEPVDPTSEIEGVEAEEPPPPPPDYEAIKAAAWTEGFQQGYDEGLRLAGEEQRDTTIRLGALLHDIVADTEGFVRGLEDDVVALVLGVAEKVIGRETSLDRSIVVSVVRSALNEIHDATEVRIRAHPDDVAILEPRWQEMLPRRVAERSELLGDDLVERGGVVVETQIGYVDSQLKTRLTQVVNTFQAVLDGEPV